MRPVLLLRWHELAQCRHVLAGFMGTVPGRVASFGVILWAAGRTPSSSQAFTSSTAPQPGTAALTWC